MVYPAEKFVGQLLNERYRVIKQVGSGGMGDVFLAEHEILHKKLAVKILHFEQSKNREYVERFRREAISASSIGHVNIADVSDFGYTNEGNAYFVMEYVEGHSLAEELKERHSLPLEFAIAVASQVALALYSAHGKGIIHRDLKPENILLTEKEGTYPFVKIVDFGISKIRHSMLEPNLRYHTLTKTGAVFGTPEYMSPEQAAGEEIYAASDIYSLGIIMYEMLTGQLPFYDTNYMKILSKQQFDIPKLPSVVNPEITGDIDAIIMKCLEKKSCNRYDSMLQLLGDLKAAYIRHGLESKLNLAFIFNTGTVQSINPLLVENPYDREIKNILDNTNNRSEKVTMDKGGAGSLTLKIAIIVSLLALGALAVWRYQTKVNTPMVAERVQASKPEEQASRPQPEIKSEQPQPARKKAQAAAPQKSSKKTMTLKVNSNIPGVRVYNRESGKTICKKTPCERKLPKEESGMMILGFEYEDFNIKPMVISLDRDMTVNLNLKTTEVEQ
ncbi:serine/threonine protein kinase [bacterium]|nr:serine/threonine protein kinase [bacterium]